MCIKPLLPMLVVSFVQYGLSDNVRGEEKEVPDSILSISVVLSDSDIFESDAVLYKIVLRNNSKSLIYLAKPQVKGLSHTLSFRRKPDKKWVQYAEISAATRGAVEGERTLAAQESYAIYGKFFADGEDRAVFAVPGEYEVCIRVKCLLGEFAAQAMPIHVRKRPAAEVEAIKEHGKALRAYLDHFTFQPILFTPPIIVA